MVVVATPIEREKQRERESVREGERESILCLCCWVHVTLENLLTAPKKHLENIFQFSGSVKISSAVTQSTFFFFFFILFIYFFGMDHFQRSWCGTHTHTEMWRSAMTESNMQMTFNTYRHSFVIIGSSVLGGFRFTSNVGLWEQAGGGLWDRAVARLHEEIYKQEWSLVLPSTPSVKTPALAWTTTSEIHTVYIHLTSWLL